MPTPVEEFGAAVRAELDKRGLSLRGATLKTGIDHSAIGRMRMGYIPRSETVIRFAHGLDLNVNEWLELAGYEPLPPLGDDSETRATADVRAAWQELKAALDEAGLPHAAPTYHGGGGQQDEEDVAVAMRWLAQQLREKKAASE